MTFKQYLLLMGIGTAAAVTAWFIVLNAIDPVSSGFPAKLAFFLTFFIASVGIFSFFGALIRVLIIHRQGVVSREVARAFRQGLFFSSILLVCLMMASLNYLRWWTMILVIFLFSGIELFFLTSGRRENA